MSKLVPFKIEHLKLMDIDNSRLVLGLDETMKRYKKVNGTAYTLFRNDGVALGCGGIEDMWTGVGEAWIILSNESMNSSLMVARNIDKKLAEFADTGKYHRIQVMVLRGFDAAIKLARFLGFKHEGLLKQYGPEREDYHMMSILR